MPVDADTPEGRILLAIIRFRPAPWSPPPKPGKDGKPRPPRKRKRKRPEKVRRAGYADAVAVVLAEAETLGLAVALAALEGLHAAGIVVRWDLPDGSASSGPKVTLTPWGAQQAGEAGLDRVLAEDEDEDPRSLRWEWPGRMPRHYKLPAHGRMVSLDDLELAAVREGFSYTDDERQAGIELLADRATGKPIQILGGYTVPVSRSWYDAARAAKAATTGRKTA